MLHTKNILNRMMGLGLLASMGIAALLLVSAPALAATAPDLLSNSTYGIVSSTFTNTNPSTVNGDLCCTTCGTAPTTYTGVPIVACTTQIADQATALADLLSQTCTPLSTAAPALNAEVIGANPPGVFPPGCYSSTGAMSITTGTTVTLKGAGVYIFRSGGALNPAANSIVTLAEGACASDVFWAPNGATTIGANASFVGNILEPAGAGNNITIGGATTLLGRALAAGNTVTIANDAITVPPACVALGQVFVGKVFNPSTINEGCGASDFSTLTITLSNPNTSAATITSLTDTLPAGVQVATTPNASNGCGGTFAPSAGDTILTMTGGSIPGGTPGICTLQVDVCSPTLGTNRSYINPLPAGALVTSNGNNANSVFETLIVLSPGSGPQAPTISKIFDPVLITVGDTSTLTFTLSNPSTDTANSNVAFTDNLPAELMIAGTPAITNSCNGSVSATPFGNTVTLTGGSIAAASSCTVTVNVLAVNTGSIVNTLIAGDLTSDQGASVVPAIATVTSLSGPTTPIPTLNEWGMMIFMVLAGLGSVYYLRKKYRKV